jgi:hypothetical protein
VAEHIGLGRYGDPLNVNGTSQACTELIRKLAPGGFLYFVVPVGKQRTCFNAHRVFAPETIRDYFYQLELVEFSGVYDDGRYEEHVSFESFLESKYGCGLFLFQKPE